MKVLSKAEQILTTWLRAIALVDGVALGAVFMPRAWMAGVHAWLGLGDLPSEPIVGYLARSTSLLYGFLGCILWIMASDVRHYARLINVFGWSATSWAGVFLVIDHLEGLPDWWLYSEWLCVLLIGQSVLLLQRRVVVPEALQPVRQIGDAIETRHG